MVSLQEGKINLKNVQSVVDIEICDREGLFDLACHFLYIFFFDLVKIT